MTRVVVMDLLRHNTVTVGQDRYFVLTVAGHPMLAPDRCPHRGGPLSLARRTPDGRRLICPWHGIEVGITALRRRCLPMIRSGTEAVVLLPQAGPDTAVSVSRRQILADLPPSAAHAACGGTTGRGTPRPSPGGRAPL